MADRSRVWLELNENGRAGASREVWGNVRGAGDGGEVGRWVGLAAEADLSAIDSVMDDAVAVTSLLEIDFALGEGHAGRLAIDLALDGDAVFAIDPPVDDADAVRSAIDPA